MFWFPPTRTTFDRSKGCAARIFCVLFGRPRPYLLVVPSLPGGTRGHGRTLRNELRSEDDPGGKVRRGGRGGHPRRGARRRGSRRRWSIGRAPTPGSSDTRRRCAISRRRWRSTRRPACSRPTWSTTPTSARCWARRRPRRGPRWTRAEHTLARYEDRASRAGGTWPTPPRGPTGCAARRRADRVNVGCRQVRWKPWPESRRSVSRARRLRESRRAAVLAVARRIFSQKGYHDTSIHDIIEGGRHRARHLLSLLRIEARHLRRAARRSGHDAAGAGEADRGRARTRPPRSSR